MEMKFMDGIYRDYHAKVQGYIRGKVSNVCDAEDLVSRVFEKVCGKLETFDDSRASLSTWIYTITRNTVTDFFRTRREYEELYEDSGAVDDHASEVLNQETLEELANALLKLGERERAVIVLHYYDGLTLKETAERLEMSYSNTKLVHSKAIEKLGKLIEQ